MRCGCMVLKVEEKFIYMCVTRSYEMSFKIWQFEISACLKSESSAGYFDT